ncbi:signal peptidase I [Breznakibacter xylanolyticus]|uniref:Signal peptidase I n=1 Tax=Breznakibacter xylanolyticus TaxID=990 RepID=A0A2W7MV61_9BACT|nr:signal peptidase I [Breznakibacter xylanolyticus]PZX11868.1 signal peptidase I [Breznakibacter xylanolyticus]
MLRPDWGWILFFCFVLLFCAWVRWPLLAMVTVGVAVLTFVPRVRAFFIKKHQQIGRIGRMICDWGFVVVVSLTIVVGLKSYFVDVFRLPSNSMEMTIGNGDMVVINKLILGPRMRPDDPDAFYRAPGFRKVRHNDLIVFNFPEGDTLLVNRYFESYYSLKRQYGDMKTPGGQTLLGKTAYKSVTRRPKYIKRVVALPGDTVEMRDGTLWVNHRKVSVPPTSVRKYVDATGRGDSLLKALNIRPYNRYLQKQTPIYELSVGQVAQHAALDSHVVPLRVPADQPDPYVFPHDFRWNVDHYGPVVVPARGMRLDVNERNILLYARLIDVYEGNELSVRGDEVLINGQVTRSYVCKMDYYWVMGDNQPHSFDSRYWGFLPANHIIGVSPLQFHVDGHE